MNFLRTLFVLSGIFMSPFLWASAEEDLENGGLPERSVNYSSFEIGGPEDDSTGKNRVNRRLVCKQMTKDGLRTTIGVVVGVVVVGAVIFLATYFTQEDLSLPICNHSQDF